MEEGDAWVGGMRAWKAGFVPGEGCHGRSDGDEETAQAQWEIRGVVSWSRGSAGSSSCHGRCGLCAAGATLERDSVEDSFGASDRISSWELGAWAGAGLR